MYSSFFFLYAYCILTEKLLKIHLQICINNFLTRVPENLLPLPPKLEQLMSECEEVEEWAELGAALHMTQSDLDDIEHSHVGDPDRCHRELFKVQLWL